MSPPFSCRNDPEIALIEPKRRRISPLGLPKWANHDKTTMHRADAEHLFTSLVLFSAGIFSKAGMTMRENFNPAEGQNIDC